MMRKLNLTILAAFAIVLLIGMVACKQGPATYTVRFDVNLPGSEQKMPDESFTYGEDMALFENEFTYKGHIFDGWNTKPDGTGKRYYDGEVVKNLTSEDGAVFTLYAQWADDHFVGTEWIATIDESTTLKIKFGDGMDAGKAKIFWSKSLSPDLPFFEGSYLENGRKLQFTDTDVKEPAGTEYVYYSIETGLVYMDDDPDLHVADIDFKRNLEDGCFYFPKDQYSSIITNLGTTDIVIQEREFPENDEGLSYREGDTVAHLIWDSLEFRLMTYCEQNVTKKTGTEGEWILKTEGNITRTVLIDCSFFLSSETECAIKLEIPDLMIPYAEYTFTKVEPEA